ncbi:MAG: DUF3604 domain-containing protein [Acidobacteriota bacterium]
MNPRILLLALALVPIGCGDGSPETQTASTDDAGPRSCSNATDLRQALFGDLHVHTSFSFDAAANSTGGTPADAYRFAKGESIPFFPLGADGTPEGSIRIDRPLDFVAVTDHGEFLGERRLCREPDSPRYETEYCKLTRVSERQGMTMLGAVITTETPQRIPQVCGDDGSLCLEWAASPWRAIVDAAEDANDTSDECSFTSFVGYEYTGTPGVSNYHRNVIFRNATVPSLPVSYVDAPIDSELWARLDEVCRREDGCDYLTIPHNSNLANGRMGPYRDIDPTVENRQAYAQKRMDREPIMEIFQHKGGSECINGLTSVFSEPDELCDVEAVRVIGRAETFQAANPANPTTPQQTTVVTEECPEGTIGSYGMLGAGCVDRSDYLRSALLEGLEEEAAIGFNPAKLGVIASTDTHTATPGAVSEQDWQGAVSLESTPAERLQPGLLTSGIDGNAGGLAGVWAEQNTRESIFEAMKRREVFGTSGPRIRPRFFGGWNFPADLCDRADLVEQGYALGVPMGGDLPLSQDGVPAFVAFAQRDPAESAAPLQQLQLIKGWIDAKGKAHNEIVTVAGSPDNGASVDPTTGERSGDGHDSLCAVYRDESFDPEQPSYYYLRVVENPSARWSVYDCLRLEETDRPAVCSDGSYPDTIQEMAWTSPIWFRAGDSR